MRIRSLIFCNINSLYGKWKIDFTAPEFEAAGLFLISGRTGSGKTTVLDAISLALFAETPRIGHGDNTACVSRGASECLAELTFEAGGHLCVASFAYGSGKRGSRKGKLNAVYSHRLVCDGVAVADKTRCVKEKIAELTGLDSERFRRTVLLAQGQFDAFLRAGNEKAAVLEQITGTEIYTRIASAIKERYDRARNEFEILQAQCGGITCLTPEEEKQKHTILASLETEASNLTDSLAGLEKLLRSFEREKQAEDALEKLSGEEKLLAEKRAGFQTEFLRLEAGEKAETLRPLFDRLQALEQSKKTCLDSLETLEKELPALESAEKQAQKDLAGADKTLKSLRGQHASLRALWNQVRELDRNLSAEQKRIAETEEHLARRKDAEAAAEKEVRTIAEELQKLEADQRRDALYLRDHTEDSLLAERRSGWVELLRAFESAGEKLSSAEKPLGQLRSAAGKASENAAEADAEAAAGKRALETRKEAKKFAGSNLEKELALHSLSDLNEREEILIRNLRLFRAVAGFEEERKKLRAGRPCPLCGSTDHPFAAGKVPEMDENEADLKKVRAAKEKISKLEKDLHDSERLLTAAIEKKLRLEAAAEKARSGAVHAAELLKNAASDAEKCACERDGIRKKLLAEFQSASLEWDGKTPALPPDAGKRIQLYRAASERASLFEKRKGEILSAKEVNTAKLDQIRNDARELSAELKSRKKTLQKMSLERDGLFGAKDPDPEEAAFEKSLLAAEKAFTGSSETAARAETEKVSAEGRTKKQKDFLAELSPRLETARNSFAASCGKAGFTPEECAASFLAPAELAALSAEKASMAAEAESLLSRRKDLLEIRDAERAGRPEERQEEACRLEYQDSSKHLAALREQTGALKSELAANSESLRILAEKEALLEGKKQECDLRGRLHELIGRGNNFQRLAQGITLDNLLTLANQELEKLSGRYELVRSSADTLEIDVLDQEQGGDIRTCDNLSGGERFIVSLALALGLSRMAGEKIRIDSLFLDEGFGTLDSESLQTVINTIWKLRREGKLVGIVSHVGSLAEKVSCVIEVRQTGGGRSILSGPGVSKL